MGMVAQDEREFYRELECKSPFSAWVAENVVLHLSSWVYPDEFQMDLKRYLNKFDTCHIIADWPEDIAWLCRMLITGPGNRLDTPPLTFEIDRSLDSEKSEIPHHALYDAIAVMESWKRLKGG